MSGDTWRVAATDYVKIHFFSSSPLLSTRELKRGLVLYSNGATQCFFKSRREEPARNEGSVCLLPAATRTHHVRNSVSATLCPTLSQVNVPLCNTCNKAADESIALARSLLTVQTLSSSGTNLPKRHQWISSRITERWKVRGWEVLLRIPA